MGTRRHPRRLRRTPPGDDRVSGYRWRGWTPRHEALRQWAAPNGSRPARRRAAPVRRGVQPRAGTPASSPTDAETRPGGAHTMTTDDHARRRMGRRRARRAERRRAAHRQRTRPRPRLDPVRVGPRAGPQTKLIEATAADMRASQHKSPEALIYDVLLKLECYKMAALMYPAVSGLASCRTGISTAAKAAGSRVCGGVMDRRRPVGRHDAWRPRDGIYVSPSHRAGRRPLYGRRCGTGPPRRSWDGTPAAASVAGKPAAHRPPATGTVPATTTTSAQGGPLRASPAPTPNTASGAGNGCGTPAPPTVPGDRAHRPRAPGEQPGPTGTGSADGGRVLIGPRRRRHRGTITATLRSR